MTMLTAPHGDIKFGPGLPTILINDQLRVMDQSAAVLAALCEGNLDEIINLARTGLALGTDMVDVLVYHPDLNEEELLPQIVSRIKKEIGCPICLDSANPAAIEAGLAALRPYKGMINSVTATTAALDTILPIAKQYGAAVVGMPIGDHHGLAKDPAHRLAEAKMIVEACLGIGIPRQDIVMDAVCLAAGVEDKSFNLVLETLRLFRQELGLSTILGIGNAGHGMPWATMIDLTYLLGAIPWGLDAALVNPATAGLVNMVRAMDFLMGKDAAGRRYLHHYRQQKKVGQHD